MASMEYSGDGIARSPVETAIETTRHSTNRKRFIEAFSGDRKARPF
jgi:hypothetical protein